MSEVPAAAKPESPEISVHLVKPWNLSTRKFHATFLNGKPVDIEYSFDPERMEDDQVLINMNCLRPVFGGKLPLTRYHNFGSIFELYEFIKEEVQLDECSNQRHAACTCHLARAGEEFYGVVMKPDVVECENKHFHHYCWEHVISWLINYLYTSILLRESEEHFKQAIAEQYASFPEDIPYFQTGERATYEFLLKNAHEIDTAIYEGEGAIDFICSCHNVPAG